MRNAVDTSVDELFATVVGFIDQLLANMPAGAETAQYCGDMSDTVTGYRGINVFLYTDGAGNKNLQVNGPEPLLVKLTQHYSYDPWGRGRKHLVFHIV